MFVCKVQHLETGYLGKNRHVATSNDETAGSESLVGSNAVVDAEVKNVHLKMSFRVLKRSPAPTLFGWS